MARCTCVARRTTWQTPRVAFAQLRIPTPRRSRSTTCSIRPPRRRCWPRSRAIEPRIHRDAPQVALASRAGESRWRVALAIGWGIFVTYAATMAVIAFGESEGVVIGTLGAFAG